MPGRMQAAVALASSPVGRWQAVGVLAELEQRQVYGGTHSLYPLTLVGYPLTFSGTETV